MSSGQDILDRARYTLLDTGSETKLPDADALVGINKYIDDLDEQLAIWDAREILGSHHSEDNAEITLVSGQEIYDLPSDFLAPEEPFVYLSQWPMTPIADFHIERWRSETGMPLYWSLRNVSGTKKLILLPYPDDDAVTNYSPVKIYYFKKTTHLATLATTFPFADDFTRDCEEYLILWAKYRIMKATNIDFILRDWVQQRVFTVLSLQRPDLDITSSSRLIDLMNYEI